MNKQSLKFSLILCTVNREKDVEVFLESIFLQSYNNFEVIIVDQNLDNRINNILEKFPSISNKIKVVKSKKGLSRARNVGLDHVSGDIIAFPDDDCIYSSDVLERVESFFKNKDNNQIVYSSNTKDNDSGFSLIETPKNAMSFNKDNLIGCSFTLFFDSSISNIKFDERLGVGSGFIWGSAEENDYLYRVLSDNSTGYFEPDVFVFHPAKEHGNLDVDRAYYYGAGLAAFRLKHFSKMRCFKSFIGLTKDALFLLICLKFKRFSFKFMYLIGYTMGLIAWGVSVR